MRRPFSKRYLGLAVGKKSVYVCSFKQQAVGLSDTGILTWLKTKGRAGLFLKSTLTPLVGVTDICSRYNC